MRRPITATACFSSPAPWVFALTLLVRLLVLSRFADTPYLVPQGDDMYFYHSWGIRILGGQWTDHQAFYGLPGYAYLLALIYRFVGVQPFAVGALQCLVEALTSVVIYRLGCETFASLRGESSNPRIVSRHQLIGMLAAIGWAFFLPAQTFSIILMPTCWLVLAFWGCLLWLMRIQSDSVWRPWLWIGLLMGFVAMFVATILFLWPLVLFAIVRNTGKSAPAPAKRWLSRACALSVFVASLFAGAAPAWIHNYFIAREPVLLSAHSGLNLWIGNNPNATGYPRIPPGLRASQDGLLRDSITLAEKHAGRHLTRAEVSKFWSELANGWIRENRGIWIRLMGAKLANFWNALQYDDLSIIKLLLNDGVLMPGIRFGIVAAFGLTGLLWGVWRYPKSRWIAAGVILHMLALMPVFITERYRLCAVPGLLIFGAFLLTEVWRSLQNQEWKTAAALIVMTFAGAWFVSMGRPDPENWSLDHYKAGIRSIDSGKLANAERELTAAYAYVPENAEIVFALGNLRFAQNRPDAAKPWYRRTLEINPNHSGAWNNVGVIALNEKKWTIAERAFQRALNAEPEDAKTWYLLARAYLEQRRRKEALDSIQRAIQLRPKISEFQSLKTQIEALPPQ